MLGSKDHVLSSAGMPVLARVEDGPSDGVRQGYALVVSPTPEMIREAKDQTEKILTVVTLLADEEPSGELKEALEEMMADETPAFVPIAPPFVLCWN